MTVPDLAPLTPESLIRQYVALQADIKRMQVELDACKAQLNLLHNDGEIFDKYVCPYGSATRVSSDRYTYSDAIANLQQQERDEGIATKKTSHHWRITPATPEQLDF